MTVPWRADDLSISVIMSPQPASRIAQRSMSSYASRSRLDQVSGKKSHYGSLMAHRGQAGIREELLIRDGACMITKEISSLVCNAAHIVPQSRLDVSMFAHVRFVLSCTPVYKELQGDSYGMFEASAGLLLQETFHESYDALKWSLYLKVCFP